MKNDTTLDVMRENDIAVMVIGMEDGWWNWKPVYATDIEGLDDGQMAAHIGDKAVKMMRELRSNRDAEGGGT